MKIAIVKLSALGDIVHAMVALQFIRAALPDAQIDWLVEQRFAEVLAHNPDIHQVLTINLKGLKRNKREIFSQIQQVRQYAAQNYDLVIDAQGLLKSAITARLLGKTVAGFARDSIRESIASTFYQYKISIPYHANTIDRNAAVLSHALGFTIGPQQILQKQPFLFFDNANPLLSDFLSTQQKNIVFVISSTWESRNYPIEKFAEIARALAENVLVIWGNAQEKAKAEALAEQAGNIRVLPALNLNDIKALMAQADLVIGNDTGPTHIAWGLNKASITIFGPTPMSRVYQTPINKVVKSASLVNPYKLNKQDFSIRDIDAQVIIDLAKDLLFSTTRY